MLELTCLFYLTKIFKISLYLTQTSQDSLDRR